MYNILLIVLLSIGYTNNINYQLLDLLYEDENWILNEVLDGHSSIYTKNINDINLKAIKISRNIEINPIKILDVIKNISNYNQVLQNSPNIITTPIQSQNNIIAKQYVSVPVLSDLYYFFQIYESFNKVYWVLENPDYYKEYHISGYPLSIGCGGWDYKKNDDGSYQINYRLIFDIDGYPNWIINYINYHSLINVFNDVIKAALNKNL